MVYSIHSPMPPAPHSAAYPFPALLRDLLTRIRPKRRTFWVATCCTLIGHIAGLYPPYALASLVTFFTAYRSGQSLQPVVTIFLIWIVVSVVRYIGMQLGVYWGYQVAEKTALDAQQQTLKHLLILDLKWHERENAGNKIKRLDKGRDGIDRIIRMWFDTAIDSCVNFVGMTVILASFDPLVGLGTVFFMLTYALLSIPLTRRGGEASNATNQMEEDVAGLSFEIISNVRSVKVLGMGQGLLTIVKGKFGEWFQKIRTRVRLFRVRAAALNLWAQTFRVGISAFIVWGIVQGRYEVGFLILFYSYFGYVWISLERLSDITLDFVVSRYNLLRMKQILDVPAGIDREDGKRAFPADWKQLTMDKVSFSYGDNKNVLHDVSLNVRRGERIGIVGISGAGKSTLFKLFLKEHEHYAGRILIDDVPLRDISRSSFFGAAAVVLQDTEVFNFTLRENIIMANPDRAGDEDLLHRALEVAHITDFLPRLPDGLETVIGEKGIKLSGGEKQRVGIARAIFKDPQMLFLDEATSHLDLESEEKIRDSLHQFFQSVTAVVIAHRLTTIREMNRIIVIEDGRIIEEGSFEVLRAKKGRFNELWEMQRL